MEFSRIRMIIRALQLRLLYYTSLPPSIKYSQSCVLFTVENENVSPSKERRMYVKRLESHDFPYIRVSFVAYNSFIYSHSISPSNST